ncbi:MAG TPA: DHHA1 domain-containing protein, partial [Thermoleophilia bacterium]
FFEEKYGEFVRVLEIDDFSRELCGGTHVSSTSQIGLCKITSSQSVGANTRRLEAITSAKAIEHYRELEASWGDIAAALGVKPDRVPAAVRKMAARLADLEKTLKTVESGEVRGRLDELLARFEQVGGIPVLAAHHQVSSADELLVIADEMRARQPDAAVLLAADVGGRAALVVTLGDAAVGRGLHAQDVLRAMLPAVEGKGGGKPTLARGGGPEVAGIPAGLEAGLAVVRESLGA